MVLLMLALTFLSFDLSISIIYLSIYLLEKRQ
jgi:hypothetical protein